MEKQKYSLETIRHSLAHILAAAVQELYPQVKLGIGPAIDNGFYYDFDFSPTGKILTPSDLPVIEKRMREILKQNLLFQKEIIGDVDKAKEIFQDQPLKIELIDDLQKADQTPQISVWHTGKFIDLCKGPHVISTKDIPADAFKLTKVAGAYWKGLETNQMLTRIYGLAFASKDELDAFIKIEQEAEKRDHRKLGKELDLFHIDEEVGLGLALWHPKGAILWRVIEDFWFDQHLKNGYELVRTPHIGKRSLWERSGHWGFYSESMYPPMEVGQSLADSKAQKKPAESEQYLLKPMNCPFHIKIYNERPRSWRDLPKRWAETGTVYRYEKKGELSGLTRVRGFTQDDAHIICRKDQVEAELKKVVDFILFIYKAFGFDKKVVNVYLSLRDPNNHQKYAGNDEGWQFTESMLRKVATDKKLTVKEDIGEAVFYGPKLDFKIKDALGREWQCSTLQFDFNLPNRFEMFFINNRGEKEQPFMLHRALFGSFERFIGLLLENYAGALPLWLAPIQIQVIPIGQAHKKYAKAIGQELKNGGWRVDVNEDNETVGKKIRGGEMQKIPYLLIVGDKEMKSKKVSIRQRHKGDIGAMSLKKFLELAQKDLQKKK